MKTIIGAIVLVGLTGCANVYVKGGVSEQLGTGVHYIVKGHDYAHAPKGHVEVGVDKQLSRRWKIGGGWQHSSIPEIPNDQGEERVFVELEWRPFKKE